MDEQKLQLTAQFIAAFKPERGQSLIKDSDGNMLWKSDDQILVVSSCIAFFILQTFFASACASESVRDEKILNVFSIVKFPNDGCNTTSKNIYGVCYTASECLSLGGFSSGSCASGFGVCCAFEGSCGGSTSVNNTYFRSTDSDSSPCRFSVCKAGSDICQLKLGFDLFDIAQPSSITPGDDNPHGRTQCQDAQFMATADGPSPPVICGSNTGYHMIIDARDDCNTLSFTWTSSTTRRWNIHIMQIPCTAEWKPPQGCLQYFTGATGYIYSYNYQGSLHLADQNYNNCIRTESGYCSISYTSVSTDSFQISLITPTASPAAIGAVGDSCTLDYIVVSEGGSTAGATTNYDRFCGSLLVHTAGTTAQTIITQKMPFQVGVNFDGTELDEDSPAGTEWSKGFSLYFSQTAC